MTDYKKYLKYKQKYLELKKKLNEQQLGLVGSYVSQIGGTRIVKTIDNTGEREGMELQCFWISILDYLNHHGHPDLTLRELRTQADLNQDTEHTMFDIDYLVGPELDRQAIFFNAAIQVAEIYDLRIQIYTARRNGEVEITTPRGLIGTGTNLVEIAQFGIGHFELIDETNGTDFIPAVLVKGKLKKDIDDPAMKYVYMELSEHHGLLKILKDTLKVNSTVYNKELETKKDLTQSQFLTSDQKAIFITQYDKNLDELVTEINLIENKISRLEEEISSLTLIISNFENE